MRLWPPGPRPDVADTQRSPGVVAAAIAGLLGALHLAGGTATVVLAAVPPAEAVLALARAVLGGILLPTVAGLASGAGWSRSLGVVAFAGLAVVQLLPLLAGATLAVPLAGILLSGTCALYLVLAPGEFTDGDDGRPISEDTDPHDFVR